MAAKKPKRLTLGERNRMGFRSLEKRFTPEELQTADDVRELIIKKIHELAEIERKREQMLREYNLITQRIYAGSGELQALQRRLRSKLNVKSINLDDLDD